MNMKATDVKSNARLIDMRSTNSEAGMPMVVIASSEIAMVGKPICGRERKAGQYGGLISPTATHTDLAQIIVGAPDARHGYFQVTGLCKFIGAYLNHWLLELELNRADLGF
jgi:hypothetical protein